MNILRFKPNEPSGVYRFFGTAAASDLDTEGDSNAPVLLLLNGRKVLTVFPVALVARPISISNSFMTCDHVCRPNNQTSLAFTGTRN